MHSLPTVAKRDRDVPFAVTADNGEADTPDTEPDLLGNSINLTDLEATFRATLSRLSSTSARLAPLPSGPDAPELTFTMTIELRPNADRPVGKLDENERRWIVADPDPTESQPPASQHHNGAKAVPAKSKTHPIRLLTTAPHPSPLHIELWVEESAFKLSSQQQSTQSSTTSYRDPATRLKETSFGAGKEKFFDPLNGYGDDDIEGTDVNRKPGGGVGLDYRGMRG